ncbi:MAG: ribosome maturation factor RimP [Campylobacter sp.]|nr:ribosome maturation factor RimP [Campylobacter sp.]
MVDLALIANECGVKFYDSEIVSENDCTIFRVYITKDGGVSLDDCENLSRILSPIFDVKPPVNRDYILEVSSPGLERKLSKKEHFANSIGELVKLTLNNKEKFSGEIVSFNGESLTIKTDEKEQNFSINDIKLAKTYVDWGKF